MTDDEFLKLCRVAPKTQQMKVLLMTTTLVEYKRRRQNAPATVESFDGDVDDDAQEVTADDETPVNNVPAGETLEETQRRRRRELGIKGYED